MPITLVRPDGSLIRVNDETEASKLRTLGYKDESAGSELERNVEAGQEDYYTTGGQKVLTAGEGLLSGLSLGGSDLLINGEGTQERAKYNPGTRLASELVGGLLPTIPGAEFLHFTPAGALAEGAAKAGEMVGRGSATIAAATQGAVEGAGFGANQEVTQAELSGDPLTAESIVAGMGWGAIYGGGLAALGSKAQEVFSGRASRAALDKEAALGPTKAEIIANNEADRAQAEARVHAALRDGIDVDHARTGGMEERHYGNFSGAVHDAATELGKVKVSADLSNLAPGLISPSELSMTNPRTTDLSSLEQGLVSPDELGRIGKPVERPLPDVSSGMVSPDELGRMGEPRPTHMPIEPTPLSEIGPIEGSTGIEDQVNKAMEGVPRPKFEFRPLKNKFSSIESSLIDSGNIKLVRSSVRGAQKSLDKLMTAAAEGDFEALTTHLESFKSHMGEIGRTLSMPEAIKLTEGVDRTIGAVGKYQADVEAAGSKAREELIRQDERGNLEARERRAQGMEAARDRFGNKVEDTAAEDSALRKAMYDQAKSGIQQGMTPEKPNMKPLAKFYHDMATGSAVNLEDHISPLIKFYQDRGIKAAEEVANMTAIKGVLSKFPKTAEEFAGMTSKKVEQLSAALDRFNGLNSAEMSGVKDGLKDALESLKQGIGIKVEGTMGEQLREIHGLLKEARSARAAESVRMAKEGEALWERSSKADNRASQVRMNRDEDVVRNVRAAGGKVPWAPRYLAGHAMASQFNTGLGKSMAYVGGSWLVSRLMGLKGAVMGSISEKANAWLPRIGRATKFIGPRVEPLMTRLDGMEEKRRAERTELMRRRAKEVAEAAPAVRDTLYRAVQPLAISSPELAAAMHAHSVDRFQFLLSKMPKDPGLAYSNLQSIWKPDPVATEKFARYYEVFHNPVAVVVRALQTGRITLEAADGLKNMNPELFTYLRTSLIERLAHPEVQKRMSYEDQVHLGVLLDLPVHSSMDPRFIASQQQMYTERNKPLEMNPRIQPGGGAGRPSGPGPNATAAQRATEH